MKDTAAFRGMEHGSGTVHGGSPMKDMTTHTHSHAHARPLHASVAPTCPTHSSKVPEPTSRSNRRQRKRRPTSRCLHALQPCNSVAPTTTDTTTNHKPQPDTATRSQPRTPRAISPRFIPPHACPSEPAMQLLQHPPRDNNQEGHPTPYQADGPSSQCTEQLCYTCNSFLGAFDGPPDSPHSSHASDQLEAPDNVWTSTKSGLPADPHTSVPTTPRATNYEPPNNPNSCSRPVSTSLAPVSGISNIFSLKWFQPRIFSSSAAAATLEPSIEASKATDCSPSDTGRKSKSNLPQKTQAQVLSNPRLLSQRSNHSTQGSSHSVPVSPQQTSSSNARTQTEDVPDTSLSLFLMHQHSTTTTTTCAAPVTPDGVVSGGQLEAAEGPAHGTAEMRRVKYPHSATRLVSLPESYYEASPAASRATSRVSTPVLPGISSWNSILSAACSTYPSNSPQPDSRDTGANSTMGCAAGAVTGGFDHMIPVLVQLQHALERGSLVHEVVVPVHQFLPLIRTKCGHTEVETSTTCNSFLNSSIPPHLAHLPPWAQPTTSASVPTNHNNCSYMGPSSRTSARTDSWPAQLPPPASLPNQPSCHANPAHHGFMYSSPGGMLPSPNNLLEPGNMRVLSSVGTYPFGNETPRTPTHEIGRTLPISEGSCVFDYYYDRETSGKGTKTSRDCLSWTSQGTNTNTNVASSIPDVSERFLEQRKPAQNPRKDRNSRLFQHNNPFFNSDSMTLPLENPPSLRLPGNPSATQQRVATRVPGAHASSLSATAEHGTLWPRLHSDGSSSFSDSQAASVLASAGRSSGISTSSKKKSDGYVHRLLQLTVCNTKLPASTPLAGPPQPTPRQGGVPRMHSQSAQASHHNTPQRNKSSFAPCMSLCRNSNTMHGSHASGRPEIWEEMENSQDIEGASPDAHPPCMQPQRRSRGLFKFCAAPDESASEDDSLRSRNSTETRTHTKHALSQHLRCCSFPPPSTTPSLSTRGGVAPVRLGKGVTGKRMHALWRHMRYRSATKTAKKYTEGSAQLLHEVSSARKYRHGTDGNSPSPISRNRSASQFSAEQHSIAQGMSNVSRTRESEEDSCLWKEKAAAAILERMPGGSNACSGSMNIPEGSADGGGARALRLYPQPQPVRRL